MNLLLPALLATAINSWSLPADTIEVTAHVSSIERSRHVFVYSVDGDQPNTMSSSARVYLSPPCPVSYVQMMLDYDHPLIEAGDTLCALVRRSTGTLLTVRGIRRSTVRTYLSWSLSHVVPANVRAIKPGRSWTLVSQLKPDTIRCFIDTVTVRYQWSAMAADTAWATSTVQTALAVNERPHVGGWLDCIVDPTGHLLYLLNHVPAKRRP